MSNKANPVATLTAILCERYFNAPRSSKSRAQNARMPWVDGSQCAAEWARLSSELCRLAPAFKRQGVVECNGEWFDGQRDRFHQEPIDVYIAWNEQVQKGIATERVRLTRKLDAINVKLAQFRLCANGHAGGGLYLGIASTDPTRPLDMIVGA